MVARLIGSLLFGGLIVLLASSNAQIVETRIGPLVVAAPHFLVLGVAFFLGFATAVTTVVTFLLKQRKKKSSTRSIVISR